VPEKRLRIFELAAELLDERGCAARFWRVDGMTERA
jgi:hypothetical protein